MNDFEFENGLESLLGDSLVDDQPSNTEDVVTTVGNDLLDTQEPNSVEPNDAPAEEPKEDFMSKFLSEFGIQNGKITYENDDDTTEEVNFNELDDDEKINILKEITSPNLSKDEIDVINYLRSNNATMQDVIEYYSNKAVKEYIDKNGPVQRTYTIDEYSDDELYLADLKSKFEGMSEEEMQSDLENAKGDAELFKKKVDLIRKRYIAQEEEQEKEQQRLEEERYQQFQNSIQDQINNFAVSVDYTDDSAYKLQIEDHEKDAIWDYILRVDDTGTSQFVKDLSKTDKIVEMAWYTLFGKDAMADIGQY